MTGREHNRLLSIFFFIYGGLQLLGGFVVVLIYVVLGGAMLATSGRDDEHFVGGIFIILAVVLGVLILVISGLHIFAGFKLRREQPSGRILGIVCSILALFGFPLGTAMGVYGLWFLFGDAGRAIYFGGGESSPTQPGRWR